MSESTVDKLSKLISASYFKFVVVGGINTAFNYSLYAFLIFVGLGHIISATCAFVIGIIFNYNTHGKYVFHTRNSRSFHLYIISWIILYGVNISALDLLIRNGVDSYIAGALLVPPMAVLAFVVLRYIVFRPRKTS